MKSVLTTLALGAIVTLLGYASYRTTRWGGSCGFTQVEHALTFVDSKGSPIEGIELRVEDQRGNKFFCFPVTDYLPGKAPTSDKDGLVRFHHVSTAVEWDNYGWALFWIYPVQTTRSPVYVCRFLYGDMEVYRVRYDDLPDWDWPDQGWEQVPKVKRQWNWSATIPKTIQYKPWDTDESYNSRLHSFFHIDGKGKLCREAIVACRNAVWLVDFRKGTEKLEFPVIRRTITVKVLGDAK